MAIELDPKKGTRAWHTDTSSLPGWVIQWRFGRTSSRALAIEQLRIRPSVAIGKPPTNRRAMLTVPGNGVTRRLHQQVPLHRAMSEISGHQKFVRFIAAVASVTLKEEQPKRGRGRPARHISWYRALINRYEELGTTLRKDRIVAKELGMSEVAVRVAICRAREMELL